MAIKFRCAFCQKLLAIAQRKAGSVVKCPKCMGEILVPSVIPDDGSESDEAVEAAPDPKPEPKFEARPEPKLDVRPEPKPNKPPELPARPAKAKPPSKTAIPIPAAAPSAPPKPKARPESNAFEAVEAVPSKLTRRDVVVITKKQARLGYSAVGGLVFLALVTGLLMGRLWGRSSLPRTPTPEAIESPASN